MANFKLIIEYDGSAYHGWQRQKNEPTIQEAIETALTTMTREKISVIGSGRTDAGVHALAQTANFHCHSRLSPDNFKNGLNCLLADDIVIKACEKAADDFHARFSARSKTYHYWILNYPEPAAIGRRYAWHVRRPLDIDAMRRALADIIGEHDFKSFEGAGSPRESTIRHVLAGSINRSFEKYLCFEITADGFLRYMVRNITGTLMEIGIGKRPPEEMRAILSARDRSWASPTAPPQGLFLVEVKY